MKSYSVSQSRVNKLLKYRDEQIRLLNSLKGDTSAKNMLALEIKTIEVSLITLGIEFKKSNVDFIL